MATTKTKMRVPLFINSVALPRPGQARQQQQQHHCNLRNCPHRKSKQQQQQLDLNTVALQEGQRKPPVKTHQRHPLPLLRAAIEKQQRLSARLSHGSRDMTSLWRIILTLETAMCHINMTSTHSLVTGFQNNVINTS